MKYNCKTCDYTTDRSSNWARHNNSKTHLKKVQDVTNKENDKKLVGSRAGSRADSDKQDNTIEKDNKEFVCPHCDKSFNHKQSLLRHIKHRCTEKKENITNSRCNKKEKSNSIEEFEKEKFDYIKDIIEELKKDKEYFKSLVTSAGNITATAVNSSTSALKYIMQNFNNAPPLEPMKNYLAIKNDCGDQHIAIFLCDHYNDKTLVKYLGCKLLEHYKKSNAADQSLWTSDCSRLNYIIRSVVENEPGWIIDKRGIKIKKLIVTPLLNHIRIELEEFIKDPKNLFFSPRFHTCVCIINDIRGNVISDDIIRFLSPYFHFTQKS
jgi:hypothetical protein